MVQNERGEFPHRDATPAELHGCVGGMGPAASKLAFGRATRVGQFFGDVRAGMNVRAVRRQTMPVPAAGGSSAPSVCGPLGCT